MRINAFKPHVVEETPDKPEQDTHNQKASTKELGDKYEQTSRTHKFLNRAIVRHIKQFNERNTPAPRRAPRSGPLLMRNEEKFLRNPTVRAYYRIAKEFEAVMLDSNHPNFKDMEKFLITPGNDRKSLNSGLIDSRLMLQEQALEAWHERHNKRFDKQVHNTQEQIIKRNEKIKNHGRGFGGRMTKVVGETKAASFYAKNHLTVRGQMFALNNELFGKSLYEMLPRYGSRKGQHMAVRITQFGINAIIMAAGYSLVPVTFGISSIVSGHAQTIITLSGEVIALKLDGAKSKKIVSHAALRGVQLELLRVPIAGTIPNYIENGLMGTAAAGIVSTTLADWIMQSMSDRYTSTITTDDLGDPSVLREIDDRIDYLSRFLLPTGQRMLLKETRPEHQAQLRKILKRHFRTLEVLEHKRSKTLDFYRLALLAEKVPLSHRELIRQACMKEDDKKYTNTHRTVRRCLTTMMAASA